MSTAAAMTAILRPRRRRPAGFLATAAAIAMVAIVLVGVLGPLLAPFPPHQEHLVDSLRGPGNGYLLGTDDLGRDVLSRVIDGVRPALIGPAIVALGSLVFGSILGLTAGYRGGVADAAIMRAADAMYALPAVLVGIVVVGVVGGGYYVAVLLLLVLTIPYDTRVVRGATLEQRGLPYVEAARCVGVSPRRIMTRHIWPNVLPVELANAFVNFALSLVSLSALSFLGIGASPGDADWGRMLAEGRSLIAGNVLVALAPGLMIVITAVSMNILGDVVYERLSEARGDDRL